MCMSNVNPNMKQVPLIKNKTINNNSVYMNRNNQLNGQIEDIRKLPAYKDDILANFTNYTKIIISSIDNNLNSFKNSNFARIILQTTQPAHLVTILSVILVAFLMLPKASKINNISPIWTLIYLASFSAHFGAQIWMTFISGLSLYFTMPRHTFGDIQQVLFPKYFFLNATLSLITLTLFLKANNADFNKPEITIQVIAMVICFSTELLIRLYLTPPLLRLMTIKNKIEKSAGIGMEIGKLVAGNLLNCPHYKKIHITFRRVHMTIAFGNILSMGCTILHLYYLSQKICIT